VIHRLAIALLASACPGWAGESTPQPKVPRPIPLQADVKWPAPAPLVKEHAASPARTAGDALVLPDKGRARVPAASDPVDRERVYIDQPGDGRVWVRGKFYKASFGPEGATFVPYFGAEAPRNFPIQLALESARVGDQALALGHGDVSIAGHHVTIERGVLDEVYVVSVDAIEQTFVLGAVATPGPLALKIDVQTELALERDGQGFAFSNAYGRVQMSGAFVVDAVGRKQALEARLVDGDLEITVPQAFMALAQFPITVDPVINTVAVDVSSFDDFQADIAYDATFDRFMVVYEEAFSATDHDVYSVALDGAGNVLSFSGDYIDYTTDFWADPRIANNNLADSFLVVARSVPAADGTHSISARSRSAAGTLGVQVIASGAEIGNKWGPDVGGDPVLSGPTYFLLVYRRIYSGTDSDIHARLLNADGSSAGGTIFIDNSSDTLDSNCTVSKSNGIEPFNTQNWNIVWSRYMASGNHSDIFAAQVLWDGGLTSAPTAVDTTGANDAFPSASSPLDPTGGSNPRTWMIVTQRQFTPDNDLYGWLMSNANVMSIQNLSALDGINHFENQVNPAVDSNGSTFTVGFAENYATSLTDFDIYATTYRSSGSSLSTSESHALLDFSNQASLAVQITAKYSGGATSRRFGLSWQNDNGTDSDIWAGTYDAPLSGAIAGYCFGDGSGTPCPCANTGGIGHGCANSSNALGARLSTSGNSTVSADTLTLIGSGMPSVTTCLFYQGTGSTSVVFGDGLRCVNGTTVRLGTKTVSGGNAQYPSGADAPVSVRGQVPASGATRYYQAWYRNSAAFCTPATFNLSNGVSVVWLP
jgi:hypothetical protein